MGRPRKDDLKLPVAPFTAWLETHRPPDVSLGEWERTLGLGVDSLRHYTSRRHATVRLSFVDRVLTLAGGHLMDVYPDLYEFEEIA